jgi:hypothetical protein
MSLAAPDHGAQDYPVHRGNKRMADGSDRISLRARIVWHVAIYAVTVPVYFLLSDGEGRNELLILLMVIFYPVAAAVDVLRALRMSRRR